MTISRPCLTCRQLTTNPRRCNDCQTTYNRLHPKPKRPHYAGDYQARAKAVRESAQYCWICLEGARGTSAKNDDVDLVWQMTKVDGRLVMIRQKHRHTWIPERINLIIHDQHKMFTQDIQGGERLTQALKMLEELNIDPTISLDAMWAEVKERAETIYHVVRKTARQAHTQRREQMHDPLFEQF